MRRSAWGSSISTSAKPGDALGYLQRRLSTAARRGYRRINLYLWREAYRLIGDGESARACT